MLISPCKFCGAEPKFSLAEHVFAYRHGNMMVGKTNRMLICPNCGLKSTANEILVKNDENRRSKEQILLWNNAQKFSMKDKIRNIIEKINLRIEENNTQIKIKLKDNIEYNDFIVKKFLLSERLIRIFDNITYEGINSYEFVKNDDSFEVKYGISAILENNSTVDFLFVDEKMPFDNIRFLEDDDSLNVYLKDEQHRWYNHLSISLHD